MGCSVYICVCVWHRCLFHIKLLRRAYIYFALKYFILTEKALLEVFQVEERAKKKEEEANLFTIRSRPEFESQTTFGYTLCRDDVSIVGCFAYCLMFEAAVVFFGSLLIK